MLPHHISHSSLAIVAHSGVPLLWDFKTGLEHRRKQHKYILSRLSSYTALLLSQKHTSTITSPHFLSTHHSLLLCNAQFVALTPSRHSCGDITLLPLWCMKVSSRHPVSVTNHTLLAHSVGLSGSRGVRTKGRN
jgi:hypothetical protein